MCHHSSLLVIIIHHSSSFLSSVVAEIVAAGGIAIANFDCVSRGASIVAACMSAYGRVDILINNAGIVHNAPLASMTNEDWAQHMKIHLDGAYIMTKAVWPIMKAQHYGRIIMTSSPTGLYGEQTVSHYATVKVRMR